MSDEVFADMLSGGHPNSLGRTVEVVDLVLADPKRFEKLFACYKSDDPVVRLRTSNAMKRVEEAEPSLLVPYIDRFLDEVATLDQPSAQWTVAQLMLRFSKKGSLNAAQREAAETLLRAYLQQANDWIVLNATMDTLSAWAKHDVALAAWLKPELERHAQDTRKSVAGRAKKALAKLADLS